MWIPLEQQNNCPAGANGIGSFTSTKKTECELEVGITICFAVDADAHHRDDARRMAVSKNTVFTSAESIIESRPRSVIFS
jgi:hypothetical protein